MIWSRDDTVRFCSKVNVFTVVGLLIEFFGFEEKIGKTPGELKDITAALYTLISEFAKNDVDVNSAR